jgi:hypothetical protein
MIFPMNLKLMSFDLVTFELLKLEHPEGKDGVKASFKFVNG